MCEITIELFLKNSMDLAQLYRNAVNGEAAEERKLFDYLYDSFRAIIRLKNIEPDDAEDIVQASLMQIASNYRKIQITSSFAGWAHTVFRNQMIDHYRKVKTRRQRTTELADEQAAAVDFPNPRLKAALIDCLQKIDEQNPRYARLFTLSFQGYGTEEICEQMGIKRGAMYVILSRARVALKECLRKKGVLGV